MRSHYPDLGGAYDSLDQISLSARPMGDTSWIPEMNSDASSVWKFCAPSSDVISRETSDIVSDCQVFSPTTLDKNDTLLLVLVPSRAPESIQVQSTGPRSILIEWSPVPQQYVHGILRGYHVYYKTGKPKVKRSTSLVGVIKAMSVNKSSQNLEIKGLEPFTSYDVWVAAFTDAGSGPSSTPVTVVTDEDGKYLT